MEHFLVATRELKTYTVYIILLSTPFFHGMLEYAATRNLHLFGVVIKAPIYNSWQIDQSQFQSQFLTLLDQLSNTFSFCNYR